MDIILLYYLTVMVMNIKIYLKNASVKINIHFATARIGKCGRVKRFGCNFAR